MSRAQSESEGVGAGAGDNRPSHRRAVTALLLVLGSAMVAAAFLADKLGYGNPGSFGTGQVLLVLAGLLTVLTGILRRKVIDLYRATAIVLLNILLLLSALELGAIVLYRSGLLHVYRSTVEEYPELPYYAARPWTDTYWREAALSEKYQYVPYVIWRHLPFEGETIHINEDGIRSTPGSDCGHGAYKVLTLGGSTMLGWGAPDWGTIPAYLQNGLTDILDRPVCVTNLAEDGFVSTQSVITLMAELQSGNVPDMVVFYDGINEVIAAYESGEPRAHVTLSKIASRFEQPQHPILEWVTMSRLYAVAESVARRFVQERPESDPGMLNPLVGRISPPGLAGSVAEVYLANVRITTTLAQEYGFEVFFFLQPHWAVSEKRLTTEEQVLQSRIDPALASLAQAFYTNIASAASDHERLWYIADVLDKEETQIWIDRTGHITPEGNRLVAQEMLAVIQDQLDKKEP